MRHVTVGGDGFSRRCNVTAKKVYCPNSSSIGYSKVHADPGDWIVWRTLLDDDNYLLESGRVLGHISSCDSDGEDCTGWLFVLWVFRWGGCGIRWINPKDVVECCPPFPELMHFIMSFDVSAENIKEVCRAVHRGELSEPYIEQVKSRLKEY